MAQPIKPVAKMVYVCDDVVKDPTTGKVSVLNLWDTVRVPAGQSLPYQLKNLCVFVWWRGGSGSVKTRIDIVQASTGAVIRRSKDYWIDFKDRLVSYYARYMLEGCVLPQPGYYYVETYCEDEFVDDQVFHLLLP